MCTDLQYNWQKDGAPLAYGPPDTVNVDAERISVNASSNGWLLLHIDPVRLEDAGTYRCVVDILFGNPIQVSKKVRVLAEEEQGTCMFIHLSIRLSVKNPSYRNEHIIHF